MIIIYEPEINTLTGIKATAAEVANANADVVVGKEGRILKARLGHRIAIEQVKKLGRDIQK